jgi:folate-dependent phosphoribosylglycinamide formyltransferase PurN
MSKVVVFSPNRFSLYTTTIIGMLIQKDIEVSAIFVRKLFNPDRAWNEFQRDGSRLIKKVWKKLILRQAGYRPENFETILDLRKKYNIETTRVDDFQVFNSIRVSYCSTLNDPVVVGGLMQIKPDLVMFTGGGLIRANILGNSGQGVLNCHMGVLPAYRGMDVVEWAILGGHFDQIGISVHFMDAGVDTGDILRVKHIPLIQGETISSLRNRMESIMCETFVNTCLDFLHGKVERQSQSKLDGKQYFKMHPQLQKVAAERLLLYQNKGNHS